MAYRIIYAPARKGKRTGKRVFLFAAVAGLLGAVWVVKKAGISILPGDPEVTAAALEHMVASVSQGEPVGEVFFAFCREIIDGAALPY